MNNSIADQHKSKALSTVNGKLPSPRAAVLSGPTGQPKLGLGVLISSEANL